MKKKSFIALSSALFIIAGLSGCNGGSDSVVTNMLSGLRNGFKLDSNVNLIGTPHDEIYEPITQVYHANYIFQNVDMVATQTTIVVEEEDGSSYVAMNDLIKEGEDGSGFFMELTYENEVVEIQAVDDTGAVANFGLYYGNPFAYITENDFSKVDDNTYLLNKEKSSFLASRLFGILDDVFYALIEKTTFHFENGTLKTINLEPIDVDTKLQMGYEIIDLIIDSNVEMTISDIGTAKVNAPVKKEHKAEHTALENALKAVGNNYTLIVKEEMHETNLLSYIESDNYYESHFYFADEYLFWRPGYLEEYPEYDPACDAVVKFNENGSVTGYGLDSATNTWTTGALFANGLSKVNGNTVDVFRPIVAGVAPEIFEYDAEEDAYHICKEIAPYIGYDCFVPAITAPQELSGYGTDCTIKLNDGIIDEIIVEFYYNNSFVERIGTITLDFSNIGTTSLPSDIIIG